MQSWKISKKINIISSTFLILIILLFLFYGSYVFAGNNSHEADISEGSFFSTNPDISSHKNNVSEISLNSYNYAISAKNDITIIPPNGSKIRNISNNSVDIQLSKGSKTINFSDTVESISKISFSSSIDGLDDFNVKIDFVNYITDSNLGATIVKYSVDWGNDDTTTGENIPFSALSHTYKKEGKYPITVKLTDTDGITYALRKNQSFKLTTAKFVQLWVVENKETVVASSAGISGIAVLGFALTETGKYKLLALLPLMLPLYTRIQKEDVLDQFVRGQIYGFIKANPGVHYNQIIRDLDMKNGTLSYHLYMLEKTGMIKSRKEGFRYRAFYPTGMKFPETERYRLTELQLNILKTIKENSNISQRDIAKKLNKKHQTINYNVKIMQQAGLIGLRKIGRKTSCYVNEDAALKQET
jgi:DNA-binding MarR family transcriptional regulator